MGVIKYFYEESEQVDEEEYSGLSPAELTYLLNDRRSRSSSKTRMSGRAMLTMTARRSRSMLITTCLCASPANRELSNKRAARGFGLEALCVARWYFPRSQDVADGL